MNPPAPVTSTLRPCQRSEPADIAGIYSQNAQPRPRAASSGYNPCPMELSVVLVNHNGAACLAGTLEALARNTVTEEVECIVVDSGSADKSWEGVEQAWPRARVLRFEENVGF